MTHTRIRHAFLPLTCAALMLLAGDPAFADNVVRISDTAIQAGDSFVLDVEIETESALGGFSIMLRWSSPDLSCDSAAIDRSSFDPKFLVGIPPIDYTNRMIILNLLPNYPNWPRIGPGRYHAARLYFSSSADAWDQFAFVDSAMIGAARTNFASSDGLSSIYPDIEPGMVTIGNPSPVQMRVTPGVLTFRGTWGELDPPSQQLSIYSSGGESFDWSAEWTATWLDIAPSNGKAPAEPTVSLTTFTLDTGAYDDTVVISSAMAVNSPVRVPVTLRIDTGQIEPPVVTGVLLYQNRPNPFVTYHDPDTEIRWELAESDRVHLRIYDALGRPIRTLWSGQMSAGENTVRWDGRDGQGRMVASGHYFYRLTLEGNGNSRVDADKVTLCRDRVTHWHSSTSMVAPTASAMPRAA
jgi:hypothetical protein